MLEMLLLISGLVALWKFSGSTSAVAKGAEEKANVWAEEIIMDSVLQRQDNYTAFKSSTQKYDKIVSHETFMKELRGE